MLYGALCSPEAAVWQLRWINQALYDIFIYRKGVVLMDALMRKQSEVESVKNPKHNEVYVKVLTTQSETDRLSVSLTTVKTGGEIVPHTHEVLEVIYVLEGEGSALINGERKKAEAGSIIVAPPTKEHGIKNVGDTDLLLYCVFSPGIA